jgi:hypothetical protein
MKRKNCKFSAGNWKPAFQIGVYAITLVTDLLLSSVWKICGWYITNLLLHLYQPITMIFLHISVLIEITREDILPVCFQRSCLNHTLLYSRMLRADILYSIGALLPSVPALGTWINWNTLLVSLTSYKWFCYLLQCLASDLFILSSLTKVKRIYILDTMLRTLSCNFIVCILYLPVI